MFVKICGITSEDDALLAVAMGADAVGFVFAASPRQVAAQRVYDITRRLPPEILTVGVFRDEHPDRVIDIVDRSGVKAAQLHGRETPEMVAHVARRVRHVIKAVAAGSDAARAAASYGTEVVLVDAPTPGSGKVFDWLLVEEVEAGPNILLAGGLNPDNVAEAVRMVQPWGVDVSSGVEREPGRKDALKMKAFIERARAAAVESGNHTGNLLDDWANGDI